MTCVTSSMQPGTYDVVVLVAGSGTASGSVAFTYELIVEDVSYFAGFATRLLRNDVCSSIVFV